MLKTMRNIRFLSLAIVGLLCCVLLSTSVMAQRTNDEEDAKPIEKPEDMDLVAVGIIKAIPKPDEIQLQNGTIYVLDNIRVPAHYENLTTEYLRNTLIGKEVGIFMNPASKDTRIDRFGNKIGHAVTAETGWVQAGLVSQGLAYAYSIPASRVLVPVLYKYEELARKADAGLWKNPLYTLRTRETIGSTVGSFQVYEDIIDDVRPRGDYVSVVFGKEVPSVFSALIKRSGNVDFNRLLTTNIVGQRVRIHGWVENNNGIMIQISHPEQMELLGLEKSPRQRIDCSQGDSETRKACMASRRPPAKEEE